MASPAQLAANRRNARKSTGPRSIEGRKRASLNALKTGMTAKTVVLPHECAEDYDQIRAALIQDYAPATSQELMLVDQIAVGYWRTIRARRYETKMFDNRLRTRKRELGMDQKPDPDKDDEGYAVMLQMTDPEELKNFFRYDATISRDYYRAISTLEKMQSARRREEARIERNAQPATPDADHVHREPGRARPGDYHSLPAEPLTGRIARQALPGTHTHDEPLLRHATANNPLAPIGFVSYYDRSQSGVQVETGLDA